MIKPDWNSVRKEIITPSTWPAIEKELRSQRLIGLDTETEGCDPSKESPIGRAKVFCITFATKDSAYFLGPEHLHLAKPLIEDYRVKKTGTNLLGFDRHALANMGIELRGVHRDTADMSRLLFPDALSHGLKHHGKQLGIEMVDYKTLMAEAAKQLELPGMEPPPKKKGKPVTPSEIWSTFTYLKDKFIEYALKDPWVSLIQTLKCEPQLKEIAL